MLKVLDSYVGRTSTNEQCDLERSSSHVQTKLDTLLLRLEVSAYEVEDSCSTVSLTALALWVLLPQRFP